MRLSHLLKLSSFLFISVNAFAYPIYQLPTYQLQTGFAYSVCNGNNLGKYYQSTGDIVPVSVGCSIVDVPDKPTLDAVILVKSSDILQQQVSNQALQQLIANQINSSPSLQTQQASANTAKANGL